MSKSLTTTSSATTLAKLKKLFGPPPILSNEDAKAYYAIMAEIIESVGSRHFLVHALVKNLTDVIWEIRLISRQKPMVIERQYRLQQEIEEKRRQREDYDDEEDAEADTAEQAEVCAEQNEQVKEADDPTKHGEHNGQADPGGQADPEGQAEQVAQVEQAVEGGAPTTQLDRMFELEAVVETAVEDCDEIILGPDADRDELKYVAALEATIGYYERLDHRVVVLMARHKDLLEQIDTVVQGFGERFRRESDNIIEGEFSETQREVPSITSPGSDAQ